jgi:Family of unknown function (DUF5522)
LHGAKVRRLNKVATWLFLLITEFPNLARQMEQEGYSRLSKLDKDEYYFTPEGYVVFTEKYLLRRGYCCKNGCRHCPYGYNIRTGKFDKKTP